MFDLNPGNKEAHAKYGCICPMRKNNYGKGQRKWLINNDCPMHGTVFGRKYRGTPKLDRQIARFLDHFQMKSWEAISRTGMILDSTDYIEKVKELGGQNAKQHTDASRTDGAADGNIKLGLRNSDHSLRNIIKQPATKRVHADGRDDGRSTAETSTDVVTRRG